MKTIWDECISPSLWFEDDENNFFLWDDDDSQDAEKDRKEMREVVMKYMRNRKEGKIEPDTVGADFLFIEGFITPKLEWDFPWIEEDFLQKCYSRIQEFEIQTWCGRDMVRENGPRIAIIKKVLTCIYNGAKSQDEYCTALIIYLYKIYHKKEYNQLKRFSSITAEEIHSLSQDEIDDVSYEKMGRILGMCEFLKIPMGKSCSVLYLMLEKERNVCINENDNDMYKDFHETDDLFEAANDQVKQWLIQDRERAWFQVYREEEAFVTACLRRNDYPSDYLEMCNCRYIGIPSQVVYALEVLKVMNPEKEYTFEEAQHYAQLYNLVDTIISLSDSLEEEVMHFFGAEDPEGDVLFHADNIKVPASGKKKENTKKVITNVAPVNVGEAKKEDYLKEISELRRRLNQQEQENRYLREMYRSAKVAQAEKDKMLSSCEREREELIALREFVYRSAQEWEDVPEEKITDMRAFLQNKQVVIIGGHISWINKMSKLFPNWMFVQLGAYKTVDGKMLENKDRVYFFTDYLNHISYNKFVAAVRERKIPFGYLHNTNIDHVIKQVYEDFE